MMAEATMAKNQDLAGCQEVFAMSITMSITMVDADAQSHHTPSLGGNPSLDRDIDFSFLPRALLEKCKPFIVRYHELNGFSSLPDILWHPETRKFVEADVILRKEFKRATSTRRAIEAKEGFVLIATVILSAEILAIGLAGWARRYPTAHKKAKALFADYAPSSRARLIERYLFSQIERSRTALDALTGST
jgi:hypothetical protein